MFWLTTKRSISRSSCWIKTWYSRMKAKKEKQTDLFEQKRPTLDIWCEIVKGKGTNEGIQSKEIHLGSKSYQLDRMQQARWSQKPSVHFGLLCARRVNRRHVVSVTQTTGFSKYIWRTATHNRTFKRCSTGLFIYTTILSILLLN